MKAKLLNRIPKSAVIALLPCFMLLFFGPTEIYFGNHSEFPFFYNEMWKLLLLEFAAGFVALTALLTLLPEKISHFVSAAVVALSVAGYVQVMFLNKQLDLLGINPDGYKPEVGKVVVNLIIWIVIIGGMIAFAKFKYELCKKGLVYISVVLVLIQLVALISLLLTGPEDAFARTDNPERLSGAEQYVVSSKDNIIVFVLDYFSSDYLNKMLEEYPDGAMCLHDFTYYDNADCVYYGTFPSVAHMLTGGEYNPEIYKKEWWDGIWSNPTTVDFYNAMHEKNYKVNMYTEAYVLAGGNYIETMGGKIDNIVNTPYEYDINNRLLMKTMAKMSAYRMAPDVLKQQFYTNVSEYSMIVQDTKEALRHANADFYQDLLTKRLSTDDENNYFIFQHLIGTHEHNTTADGHAAEATSLNETARGCMTILDEYLNQLKELGVYDNATIIVTADHGGNDKEDMGIIYFVKEPGETHDFSPVNTAPISHCDLLATVARQAGIENYSEFGTSIFDHQPDEMRPREMWIRVSDPNYQNDVFHVYSYTGNILQLITAYDMDDYEVRRMADPMYENFN